MSSSSSSSATTTDRLLVNYNDAVIYSSDLFILDSSTAWLNDACINFQLTRLQQQREERNVCVYNEQQQQQQQYDGITVQQQYLFLDPSVVSFLMHQLTEEYEDYIDELLNLNVTWNLLLPPQKITTYSIIPINDDTTINNKQQHTKRGVKKKNIVIIPISDQFGQSRIQFTRPGGGNHWSILLWSVVHQQQHQHHHDDEKCHLTTTTTTSPSSNVDVRYYHFDSCQGTNRKAAQMVARKLHKVLYANHDATNDNVGTDGNLVSVIECQTPQQRNGYDCGVLALGFAEALTTTTNTTDRAEDDDLNAKEKKYYESLLQSYFDKHGGHEYFALRLREQIGDAIRELVPFTQRIS